MRIKFLWRVIRKVANYCRLCVHVTRQIIFFCQSPCRALFEWYLLTFGVSRHSCYSQSLYLCGCWYLDLSARIPRSRRSRVYKRSTRDIYILSDSLRVYSGLRYLCYDFWNASTCVWSSRSSGGLVPFASRNFTVLHSWSAQWERIWYSTWGRSYSSQRFTLGYSLGSTSSLCSIHITSVQVTRTSLTIVVTGNTRRCSMMVRGSILQFLRRV